MLFTVSSAIPESSFVLTRGACGVRCYGIQGPPLLFWPVMDGAARIPVGAWKAKRWQMDQRRISREEGKKKKKKQKSNSVQRPLGMR